MTSVLDARSLQAYARWAGFMYLFSMAVYMAQDMILAGFSVRGDFAATAQNVADGELLYRIGLALRVVGTLTLLALGWFFYGLLRPMAPVLAMVLLVWRGVQSAIDVMGVTLRYARLEEYLADPGAGAGGVAGQMISAAHGESFQIQFVWLGVGSTLLFWLLYRSRFIPRPLALFSLAASILLIGQAFTWLIAPEAMRSLGLGMAEYTAIFIAEVGTGLWLLVRGADLRWWKGRTDTPV